MRIGIVGSGYVGLPLAVAFCEAGQDVVGVSYKPGSGTSASLARSSCACCVSEGQRCSTTTTTC